METDKIGRITAIAIIVVALFFDAIQFGATIFNFIPYVGFILAFVITASVDIFAFLTFFLWFKLSGLKFNAKIVSTLVGALFIELMPFLSALPVWTLSVVITLLIQEAASAAEKTPIIANVAQKIVEAKRGFRANG